VKLSPRQAEVQVQVEKIKEIPETIPEHCRTLFTGSDENGYFGLVQVSDSGSGIPASDKEKIFEKFHQIKQGRKIAGQGVGLGLSICRTIIQAHRGAIWVENNPGGGSRFMLLLRRGHDAEEAIPRASPPL
jgi:signal transduction histidine kinase